MTFEQWAQAIAKDVSLPSDEDGKTVSKIFEMMDEDLDEEEF